MTTKELFPYRGDTWRILRVSLANLSPEHASWSPAEDLPSIGDILWHMAESEQYWILEKVMGMGPVYSDTPDTSDLNLLYRVYDRIRRATEDALDTLTEADLDREVEIDGDWTPPSPPTVRWCLHHVYDHESYHAGQIVYLLRAQGLPLPNF